MSYYSISQSLVEKSFVFLELSQKNHDFDPLRFLSRLRNVSFSARISI